MAAELEEEEAISLQQRMAAALKDSDFQAPSTTVSHVHMYIQYIHENMET